MQKVKIKAPVKPLFTLRPPEKPKGEQVVRHVWSFDSDDIDNMQVNLLVQKAEEFVRSENITQEFTSRIVKAYTSSEYGFIECDLQVVYYDDKISDAAKIMYDNQMEAYNKALQVFNEKMKQYELDFKEWQSKVEEAERLSEIETMKKLMLKYGVNTTSESTLPL